MQHENQRIESVSRFFCESAKLLSYLVDLIGIEPMTSSMPWNFRICKLLTAKEILAGTTGKTGPICYQCYQIATKFSWQDGLGLTVGDQPVFSPSQLHPAPSTCDGPGSLKPNSATACGTFDLSPSAGSAGPVQRSEGP
jgi:hypothetical protein